MHWGVFAISAAHLYQNYLEELEGTDNVGFINKLIVTCTNLSPCFIILVELQILLK